MRETITLTDIVRAATDRAVFLDGVGEWIAKSRIVAADCDLDEIDVNEEITIEIPRWLARKIGAE